MAGATAIGSILLAVESTPGNFIDLRYAPILVAALFGGLVSAIVAGCSVIVLGFASVGVGAIDGATLVAVAVAIGMLANLLVRHNSFKLRDIILTAAAMSVGITIVLALVHAHAGFHELFLSGAPLVVSNCLAAIVCGLIV